MFSAAETMSKKSITVLLIEDSSEYAEIVQLWLSTGEGNGSQFVLNWTDCLEAGLRRLNHGDIDVILLDLGLPDSAGLETYERIRAGSSSAAVVLLSSTDSEGLALELIQRGAQDYLVK